MLIRWYHARCPKIMVLIQGQSPAAVNSNIYFDNVKIWVDGVALKNCTLE